MARTAFPNSRMVHAPFPRQHNNFLSGKLQHRTLRMKRDSAWQVLQDQLTELEQAEREEYLAQYAQRRYKEQRLELLLQAPATASSAILILP